VLDFPQKTYHNSRKSYIIVIEFVLPEIKNECYMPQMTFSKLMVEFFSFFLLNRASSKLFRLFFF